MHIDTNTLLSQLKESTLNLIAKANVLASQTEQSLNWRPDKDSWSTLECLQHLNLYGNFYLPEIDKRIRQSRHRQPVATFKSGVLGNYFAQSMLPKEKLNKMKTFKNMNPINSALDKKIIEVFIAQQQQILNLLEAAGHINIIKTKTSISISSMITLRLGDTFRFFINHNIRHFQQIARIEQARVAS
ncbi:hypothetical protein DBR32_01115 [Taibaiella sp. KBW10]|uniref:DinB family protein n=1 Tax=Taibaiella sp. KBW10 TaxID=2153357 RepID=UPI000F5AD8B0|nr:DinB family protein [Taibaiella sp. KBW10]RQO32239.1 hypothetical protein DBR32_01115 [Taibaiella sp. KBW10]